MNKTIEWNVKKVYMHAASECMRVCACVRLGVWVAWSCVFYYVNSKLNFFRWFEMNRRSKKKYQKTCKIGKPNIFAALTCEHSENSFQKWNLCEDKCNIRTKWTWLKYKCQFKYTVLNPPTVCYTFQMLSIVHLRCTKSKCISISIPICLLNNTTKKLLTNFLSCIFLHFLLRAQFCHWIILCLICSLIFRLKRKNWVFFY